MYAVDVTATDIFTKGNPRKIFEGDYFLPTGRRFDIHPDGKSFIMIQPDVGPQGQKIFVIQNFDEELKRLAPVGKERTMADASNRSECSRVTSATLAAAAGLPMHSARLTMARRWRWLNLHHSAEPA